ncbi:MAG TPA: hypothetical protein PK762_06650 [Candidatus Kapabacteria bacterium]|nr:hypothetical protein [Candidatus Kapabacteria bacterium]
MTGSHPMTKKFISSKVNVTTSTYEHKFSSWAKFRNGSVLQSYDYCQSSFD